MKKPALSLLFAALALGLIPASPAAAQNEVLAEMYGRGVHAYYCGMNQEASQYLTLAIDNGIQDPRAYYFRGMVAWSEGRTDDAKADWQTGAELEATGRTNRAIGRSLARFQGPGRICLEEIRQRARLNALALQNARSKQRYGELGVEGGAPAPVPPAATGNAKPVAPPPIPPDTENPFADDTMAGGQPNLQSDDALQGAMNDPFAGEAAAGGAAPATGDADPFGGDTGGGADPFGGDTGGGADPFGGDAGGADPFGGDAGGDPFGG